MHKSLSFTETLKYLNRFERRVTLSNIVILKSSSRFIQVDVFFFPFSSSLFEFVPFWWWFNGIVWCESEYVIAFTITIYRKFMLQRTDNCIQHILVCDYLLWQYKHHIMCSRALYSTKYVCVSLKILIQNVSIYFSSSFNSKHTSTTYQVDTFVTNVATYVSVTLL